jgi:hypothetical protein
MVLVAGAFGSHAHRHDDGTIIPMVPPVPPVLAFQAFVVALRFLIRTALPPLASCGVGPCACMGLCWRRLGKLPVPATHMVAFVAWRQDAPCQPVSALRDSEGAQLFRLRNIQVLNSDGCMAHLNCMERGVLPVLEQGVMPSPACCTILQGAAVVRCVDQRRALCRLLQALW